MFATKCAENSTELMRTQSGGLQHLRQLPDYKMNLQKRECCKEQLFYQLIQTSSISCANNQTVKVFQSSYKYTLNLYVQLLYCKEKQLNQRAATIVHMVGTIVAPQQLTEHKMSWQNREFLFVTLDKFQYKFTIILSFYVQ